MKTQHQPFLNGFVDATGLAPDQATEQWAGFSRQLSDTARERIERRGFHAGRREGVRWLQMFGQD